MRTDKKVQLDEKFKLIPDIFKSSSKKKFYKDSGHLDDSEVLKELLYFQKEQLLITEKLKVKLNLIVWFFIFIPLILAVLYYILG